ncbi:MAG TPA: peptidylprolyl isomerase [Terriglobales bacterium]|nr:peptidylprolyl isomerase [Terriglobales bacterium]
MTFRSRPVAKPTRRRARRDDTRHSIYVTLSFSLAIAAALSLMGGVFAANYYSEHWAPIAAVNGEAIGKDAVRERADMNLSRYQRQVVDYTTLRNQGKITSAEFQTLSNNASSNQDPAKIHSAALTQLQNEATLRQYATKNNISVTDAQVNDQIQVDATLPDTRHVMVIAVQPTATPPATVVTPGDDTAAQTKIQKLLDEVKAGKKWADVATESGQDAITSGGGIGDLGLVSQDTVDLDLDMVNAVFALGKVNDVTPVFKGVDGIYRFATVTTIVPKFVDADWEASVGYGDAYRAFARSEALAKAVENKIEAQYVTSPTVQRHVLEIAISKGIGTPGDGDEVKFRMLVFAPAHSEANASSVPATDASWADAKTRADAAVATLRADPSKFAAMAADTTVNDDQVVNTRGGELPWLTNPWFAVQTASGSTGLGMTNVATALYADGLAVGTILDPIEEPTNGYVVVQFEGRRPGPDQRIANAQFDINSGVDFAAEAGKISDSADEIKGGDMGWVTKYMLTADQEAAIWQTPIGGVSRMVSGNAFWVYKVVDEQTRTSDADTQFKLKSTVYPRWLAELQANALVWTDTAGIAAMAPPSPSP